MRPTPPPTTTRTPSQSTLPTSRRPFMQPSCGRLSYPPRKHPPLRRRGRRATLIAHRRPPPPLLLHAAALNSTMMTSPKMKTPWPCTPISCLKSGRTSRRSRASSRCTAASWKYGPSQTGTNINWTPFNRLPRTPSAPTAAPSTSRNASATFTSWTPCATSTRSASPRRSTVRRRCT